MRRRSAIRGAAMVALIGAAGWPALMVATSLTDLPFPILAAALLALLLVYALGGLER